MRYKDFYNNLIPEETLYRGTVIDNVPSIKKYGLVPSKGNLVNTFYGGDYDEYDIPELVFAADKKGIKSAISAILFHVGDKLNKHASQVTKNDIINHGALIIIKDSSRFKRKFDGDFQDHPNTVEPSDYYTDDSVSSDIILTGTKLVSFIKRLIKNKDFYYRFKDMFKEDFDKTELEMGKKEELEHTDDPKVAEKIATDHLKEDPKYYTKLKKCMGEEMKLNSILKQILKETKEKQSYEVKNVYLNGKRIEGITQAYSESQALFNLIWRNLPENQRKTMTPIKVSDAKRVGGFKVKKIDNPPPSSGHTWSPYRDD